MKEGFNKNLILNIIIIVLSVVLFFLTIAFLIGIMDYQRGYKVTESDMINYVRYQEYDSLVDTVYNNEANGVKHTGDMEELYAVAYYYENAVLYHAYQVSGDSKGAQEKYHKMEEYESQMGDYAFAKEEIWNLLGITE
ncbi:MAG: hypothetical protein J6B68_09490 [Lachnospiraceae bacterium]|nr:hypothetical protein [Lachnospiraceae bacterium]